MKHRLKRFLMIVALSTGFFYKAFGQQDAQFSQYMFNGIYINPAYAGYKENLNFHSYYRSQWTGLNGGPKSFTLAVDAIANQGNVGLAFQVASDKIGAQKNLTSYISYAYRLRMNDEGTSRLAFGVSGGIMQLGLDGSLLNPNDPEPEMPLGMQSATIPDARAGVFFSNERFFAGFSADNLVSSIINVRRYAYVPQPVVHLYATSGVLIPIAEDLLLKPSFLIKDDLHGPTNIDLNAFILFSDKIWLGGSYRTGMNLFKRKNLPEQLSRRNSAVGALEIFPTQALRLGYAYDFSVGPLRGQSGGSHEMSIAYYLNRGKVRMVTPRAF